MPSWDLHHREAGEKRKQPEPVCSTDTDISGAGLDQAGQKLLYQGKVVLEKIKTRSYRHCHAEVARIFFLTWAMYFQDNPLLVLSFQLNY